MQTDITRPLPRPFQPELPPSEVVEIFDNSKLSDYDACRRMFYFRHQRGWGTSSFKAELEFGTAWHHSMDFVWSQICKTEEAHHPKAFDEVEARNIHTEAYRIFCEYWREKGGSFDPETLTDLAPRTPGVAEEMLWEYIRERWSYLATYTLLHTERAFLIPLDFENDKPKYWYSGRIDKIILHQGRVRVVDHKTTAAYQKDGYFRTYFSNSFFVNSQFDGYAYAGYLLYPDRYRGDVWADCALVHKTVHNGFRVIPVNKPLSLLDGWRWATVDRINDVRGDIEAAHMQRDGTGEQAAYMYSFRPNTGNCFKYMRPCTFMDLCQGMENPTVEELPAGFIEDFWNPLDAEDMKKLQINANAVNFSRD